MARGNGVIGEHTIINKASWLGSVRVPNLVLCVGVGSRQPQLDYTL